MSKPTLTIGDFTDSFMEVIASLKKRETLIGIPQSEDRREVEKDGIGNAALLFINNFGSPANNIPARPVMEIGIRNAQDAIAKEMEKAAQSAFKQGSSALAPYYERVGIIGSNSVKKAINDQIDIDPPSAATMKNRESKGFSGSKSLLVTAQMRNAITYVVKE